MDLRSLPQNKALFRSNLLSKFCHFVRESVLIIWAFSSQTEGTIMMKRLKGTCSDLEPIVGVAGDGGATSRSHDLATSVVRTANATS